MSASASGGGSRKRIDDKPVDVGDAQRELSRRRFLKYAGASAAAIPAYAGIMDVLSENASAATLKQNAHIAAFAHHSKYHFVMDCHVTTNSFFTATQYGIADACAITGCTAQWTGSTNSVISQMVAAMHSAIASKANGIGVCLIDNTAFNSPVDKALSQGIPVIAYNADVSPGTKNSRMAYVGQNNLTAGAAVAAEVLKLGIGKGDLVAGIIATPGTGNIQPRLDGAKPVFKKAGVDFIEVGTSATEGAPEYNKISAWYAGHKSVKFMMAVDSGDSNAVAEFIKKEKLKGKVGASVWDVGLPVCQAIHAGNVTTTVDQQAYLQG
ncbi:MAG: substrate-binding domain-containing protein, partial [Solirubrobacteraceae bacterium]